MGVVEKDDGQYDTVIPVFWVTGAALFIRRADYMNAGGLDGRFCTHGGNRFVLATPFTRTCDCLCASKYCLSCGGSYS